MREYCFTEFGRAVKKKLIDLGHPQAWLIAEVSEDTGLFVDNGYLYKILTGRSSSSKIVASICKILDIEYEELTKAQVNKHY